MIFRIGLNTKGKSVNLEIWSLYSVALQIVKLY